MESRLITEQRNIRKNRKYLFYAQPSQTTRQGAVWECGFPGPDTDLHRGSYYVVYITFPPKYPYDPPKAQFKHDVYHPNVYPDRLVCLDVISAKWKPSMNISNVLSALQHLLQAPNIKSPANVDAAHNFRVNNKKYAAKVKDNIQKYHSGPVWKSIERLTEEDEKNIDLYLQAYSIAVEATLSEIENSSDLDHQLKFIDELSLILCHNDAVRNPVVQQKLPRVLNLLKNRNFYESASLVVADSCRHIDYIQNLYFDLGIFELLDFENFYKHTIAIVFSLCYKNKKNTEYFIAKYYKEERDGGNDMIDIMKKDYNDNEE